MNSLPRIPGTNTELKRDNVPAHRDSSVKEHASGRSQEAMARTVNFSKGPQLTSESRSKMPMRQQLTEEEIFRLLIQKMRIREEEELASRSLKEQMQNEIDQLLETNQGLNQKLQKLEQTEGQLMSENAAYKEKIEKMSSKLQRLKLFLNGLGTDYETLRLEAKQFKTTQNELKAEKGSIFSEISKIKSKLDQSSKVVTDQAQALSEVRQNMLSIHHSLTSAEGEKNQCYQQLRTEQNRVSSLERYIQTCAVRHSQQLDGIEKVQTRISESVAKKCGDFLLKFDCMESQLESRLVSTINDALYEVGKIRDDEIHALSVIKAMITDISKIVSE